MLRLTTKMVRGLLPCALAFLLMASGRASAEEHGAQFLLQNAEIVSAQELSDQRGREDVNIEEVILQLSNVTANASLENNSLTSQSTGANTVETGAFAGAAGVVFAVQNSGNHVIIQNTTLINVTMNP